MDAPKITSREEANAITCWAFRNGYPEHLRAGKDSKLLQDENLSRIADTEMKKLMIESSEVMTRILDLREHDPAEYRRRLEYFLRVTRHWDKNEVGPLPEAVS